MLMPLSFQRRLFQYLFGPLDDRFLYVPVELVEKGAVSGDAHDEAAVRFRVELRFPQHVAGYDIELHVASPEPYIGLDKLRELAKPIGGRNRFGADLLIE